MKYYNIMFQNKKGGVSSQVGLGTCYAHGASRCIRSFLMNTAFNLGAEQGKNSYYSRKNDKSIFPDFTFGYTFNGNTVYIKKSSYEFFYDILLQIIIVDLKFGTNGAASYLSIYSFFEKIKNLNGNLQEYLETQFKSITYVPPRNSQKVEKLLNKLSRSGQNPEKIGILNEIKKNIGEGTQENPYHYIDSFNNPEEVANTNDKMIYSTTNENTNASKLLIQNILSVISPNLKENIYVMEYSSPTPATFDYQIFQKILTICQPIIGIKSSEISNLFNSYGDETQNSKEKELKAYDDKNEIDHAINLIGVDTNNEKYIIKNSWGILWGDEGVKTITKDFLNTIFDYSVIFLFSENNKSVFENEIQSSVNEKLKLTKQEYDKKRQKLTDEINQINETLYKEMKANVDIEKKNINKQIEELTDQANVKIGSAKTKEEEDTITQDYYKNVAPLKELKNQIKENYQKKTDEASKKNDDEYYMNMEKAKNEYNENKENVKKIKTQYHLIFSFSSSGGKKKSLKKKSNRIKTNKKRSKTVRK